MSRWQPNTVERLQGAAMTLFSSHGYANVTIADITAHAQLTKRSFFNHFPDKREVLFVGAAALEEQVVQEMADEEGEPIDVAVAALTRAGEGLARYGAYASARRDIIQSSPELRERSLIKMASLAGAIAAALESGRLDARTAELVANTAVTVFRVAYDEWVDSATGEFAPVMQRMLERLRRGIA